MSQTEEKFPDQVRVKSSTIFKLKDKPTRQFITFKISDFGFIPERIIIEKIRGENNTLIIRAVLTPDEIKKEDKRLKEIEKEALEKAKALEVIEKLKQNGKSKRESELQTTKT